MKCAHPVEHINIDKIANSIECKKCGASFDFTLLVMWIDSNAGTFRDFFGSILDEIKMLKSCRADVSGAVAFSTAMKQREMEKSDNEEIFHLAESAARKIRILSKELPDDEYKNELIKLVEKIERTVIRKNGS